MTAAELAPRVERGMAWLDAHVPGWLDRIDMETLDIGDCDRCVLGQLFGSFDAGIFEVERTERPTDEVGGYGFTMLLRDVARDEYRFPIDRRECDRFWAALREAWTTAILTRRHQRRDAEQTFDAMLEALVTT